MIVLEPIGVVVGGRTEPIDDDWGAVESVLRLDDTRFGNDAVAGLEAFSHLCVVFHFHLVEEADVVTGARHPRGNPNWPRVGMFAQRAKMRPNRLGVSNCALSAVDGLDLLVRGSTPSPARRSSMSSRSCGSSSRSRVANLRGPPS
jgi:tRNA (Thr-GGU) A37 N-methylase